MSNCTPHPSVLQPCTNDAVGSLQALGVTSDIAFSEYGNMPLAKEQDSVEIEFLYEKTDWRYVFDYLYVGNFDGVPTEAIQAVPGSQTSKGFSVKLSGAPTIEDASILFWSVRIPDNLQLCQSLTAEPQYAIVPPSQEGSIELVEGQDYIEVVFDEAHPTADWFGTFQIENLVADIPQVFAFTVVERSVTGFKLAFQGAPDDGYTLRWRIS